jgi:hypothetical protein
MKGPRHPPGPFLDPGKVPSLALARAARVASVSLRNDQALTIVTASNVPALRITASPIVPTAAHAPGWWIVIFLGKPEREGVSMNHVRVFC